MSGAARISNRDFAVALCLILCSAAALGGVSLFGKLLTGSFDLPAALFVRFFVPLLLLSWMLLVMNEHGLKWGNWRVHLVRSIFALGAQFCFFYYLSQGTLLLATLLFSTSGLFLPFLTRLAFGMEIRRKTLLAVIIGFAGVAVILDPAGGIDATMLIGLLAGLFNAGSQATQHHQSKGTSTLAATIIMFALCSLYCAVILVVTDDWDRSPARSVRMAARPRLRWWPSVLPSCPYQTRPCGRGPSASSTSRRA